MPSPGAAPAPEPEPPDAALAAAAGAGEHADDLVADLLGVGVEVEQDAGGDALVLAHQAEQDVLGADVVVAEAQRLAQGQLEHLLGARRERDLPGGDLLTGADDAHDLGAHALDGDVQALQHAGGQTLLLAQQAEQDVLGADVVVLERPRLLLRENDHLPGPFCESLEHCVLPSCWGGALKGADGGPDDACWSSLPTGPTCSIGVIGTVGAWLDRAVAAGSRQADRQACAAVSRDRRRLARSVAHRREQHDLADRVAPGQQHHQAVDAQRRRRRSAACPAPAPAGTPRRRAGSPRRPSTLSRCWASKRSRCSSGSISSLKALAISMPPANASQRSTRPGSERCSRANGESSTG